MEKEHEVERFEEEQNRPTSLDVSKLTPEQLQAGIDANFGEMVETFARRLLILENILGKQLRVNVKGNLKDGRQLRIMVSNPKRATRKSKL